MAQMAKYKGKWMPMKKFIQIKEDAIKVVEKLNKTLVRSSIEDTETPLEEITEVKTIETPAVDIKALREEFKKVSGKGISPRYLNDEVWLKENIKKYNK